MAKLGHELETVQKFIDSLTDDERAELKNHPGDKAVGELPHCDQIEAKADLVAFGSGSRLIVDGWKLLNLPIESDGDSIREIRAINEAFKKQG